MVNITTKLTINDRFQFESRIRRCVDASHPARCDTSLVSTYGLARAASNMCSDGSTCLKLRRITASMYRR
jgi:hypothetical protein